jgi:hypothetical protein
MASPRVVCRHQQPQRWESASNRSSRCHSCDARRRPPGLRRGRWRRGGRCWDRSEFAGTTTTNTTMTTMITALQRFAMAGYSSCCFLTMQRWQRFGGGNRNLETEFTICPSRNCRGSIVGVNAMPLDGMCDATQMTSTTIWTTMRTTDDGGGGGVWDIFPTWMEGLHDMAMLVVNLLGIHQNVALSDGKCCCRDDDDPY